MNLISREELKQKLVFVDKFKLVNALRYPLLDGNVVASLRKIISWNMSISLKKKVKVFYLIKNNNE
jgi:hypothetical protein